MEGVGGGGGRGWGEGFGQREGMARLDAYLGGPELYITHEIFRFGGFFYNLTAKSHIYLVPKWFI